MGVLLNDKEIDYIVNNCDYSMAPASWRGEEPDEHKSVAKAQLKKDMEYFEELLGEDDIHTALGYKVMNIRRELGEGK